jgi:hypothetical protein
MIYEARGASRSSPTSKARARPPRTGSRARATSRRRHTALVGLDRVRALDRDHEEAGRDARHRAHRDRLEPDAAQARRSDEEGRPRAAAAHRRRARDRVHRRVAEYRGVDAQTVVTSATPAHAVRRRVAPSRRASPIALGSYESLIAELSPTRRPLPVVRRTAALPSSRVIRGRFRVAPPPLQLRRLQ